MAASNTTSSFQCCTRPPSTSRATLHEKGRGEEGHAILVEINFRYKRHQRVEIQQAVTLQRRD